VNGNAEEPAVAQVFRVCCAAKAQLNSMYGGIYPAGFSRDEDAGMNRRIPPFGRAVITIEVQKVRPWDPRHVVTGCPTGEPVDIRY
jgi:hypothetical protein